MEKAIKILTFFGTRPEVIKLAPLIKAIEADKACVSIVCAVGQQKELQNEALKLFDIKADYDLDIMRENQDLFHITESILHNLKSVITHESPDYVVVHGDTTTAFTAALAAFYSKIPIVHIEAGLRTGDIYRPYPEEGNRLLISKLAALHMAPTELAVRNLAKENIIKNVFNVGNTIVDSIQLVLNKPTDSPAVKDLITLPGQKILITVHRRENFGENLKEICSAITELAKTYPKVIFIWPVHPNPNVKEYVHDIMSTSPNVHLQQPVSYIDLINLLNACSLILSDSGGIQEEACILHKPILVLREETERPEVIDSGMGMLVGAERQKIIYFVKQILDSRLVLHMNQKEIYGKPGVSQIIINQLKYFRKAYIK